MNKIVVVVENGCLKNVYSDETVEIEVVDLDNSLIAEEEQVEVDNYIEQCKTSMKEVY